MKRVVIPALVGLIFVFASGAAWAQPATTPQIDMPMTGADRIHWIVDGTVGPTSLGVGVIAAGWDTAWNTPEEWGRTWKGAGKRYLQREADVAISNSIEAGLGAIWGERADYIPSHKQGVHARLGYALKTVFLAHRPDGHLAPAWGRYAGNTVNNLIENTWLPPSATTWQSTTWRSASGFGSRAIGNVWEEFAPDIVRRVFRRP